MFTEIRNRLTIQYAGVMAVFLLTFIVVSYTGVLWLLHSEEQQDIRSFAEEEAREHVVMLIRGENRIGVRTEDDNGGKIFSYTYNTKGELVDADEPALEIRSKVKTLVYNWDMPDGQGKIRKFYSVSGDRVVIIMCSVKVYDGIQEIGRIYVGEDITSYYEMLKRLLIVILVVSLIFLIIAAFVGHLLAGRAIVPIRRSFQRQQEFAADASHELRTPLSVLLTSVYAVQTDEGNNLTPFSRQVLDDMRSEVRRMSRIVSDLLTLARADAGAANLIKEKFDLADVASRVSRSFQSTAESKSITLEICSKGDMLIYADRERVNQLLMILVDNAIKYTSSGGSIRISLQSVEAPRPGIAVSVQDTGVGISEEQKKLIFERFYRADKVRPREDGGVGIGLSIAKWIVEAHGGTIEVESALNQGSSFNVIIPKNM